MPYSVRIEQFEGPLDLLLQLIEGQKMEITDVSLSAVTEPFVAHVRENQGKIPPEELADFLVIAAKLVYLKSRALLPSLTDAELDEGPDLETQLRMYKRFVEAANRLGETTKTGALSYGRSKRQNLVKMAGFMPPAGLTADMLRDTFRALVRRLEPLMQLPKAAVARIVTIEDKIQELRQRLSQGLKTSFHRFLAGGKDRHEMVVSFLALLELIKQRIVSVRQKELFQDVQLANYES